MFGLNPIVAVILQALLLVWALVYVFAHIKRQSNTEVVNLTIVTQDGESLNFGFNFTKQMSQEERKSHLDSYFELGELRRQDILDRMAKIREEAEAEQMAMQAARKAAKG